MVEPRHSPAEPAGGFRASSLPSDTETSVLGLRRGSA
jgi:hypothetical protein